MDIAVSYHETVTKLQGLDLPGKGPFDRLDWFALLEDPLFVQAERGGEQLILPLQVGPSGLSSLSSPFCFSGPWQETQRSCTMGHTVVAKSAPAAGAGAPSSNSAPAVIQA